MVEGLWSKVFTCRAYDKWAVGYVRSLLRREAVGGERHLLFCIADHYEPFRGGVASDAALATVTDWCGAYRRQVAGLTDADGRWPQHTYFYPGEDYDPVVLSELSTIVKEGHGEVEIHLHHEDDTTESLTEKLTTFRDQLHEKHGLLGTDSAGNPCYGFVHGNWTLCNSHPEGKWCGVDDELGVLAQTGCYADFTMPSAPSPTQSRMVNAVYRASDTGRPRAHDVGTILKVEPRMNTNGHEWGDAASGDVDVIRSAVAQANSGHGCFNGERKCGAEKEEQLRERTSNVQGGGTRNKEPSTRNELLLIQGPLALNWGWRKWGVMPRVENAELSGVNPPTVQRLALWMRQQVHVAGRPEWVFVKLHTHGCVPVNRDMLLGEPMQRFHRDMQAWCREKGVQLHYVTAREMANIARAAEDGHAGAPGQYRNYEIAPPPVRLAGGEVEPRMDTNSH